MEQDLLSILEHLRSSSVFSGVRGTRSVVLCAFCISLFVLLYFFFWPLYSVSFFDIRILITPLVSSNSSCYIYVEVLCYAFDFHCLLFVFRSCKLDVRSILLLSTVLNVNRHYLPIMCNIRKCIMFKRNVLYITISIYFQNSRQFLISAQMK